jgi:hypothetical protein
MMRCRILNESRRRILYEASRRKGAISGEKEVEMLFSFRRPPA